MSPVQQIKHLLGITMFDGYAGLVPHIEKLVEERNALRNSHSLFATMLKIDSTKPSDILNAIKKLTIERDELKLQNNTYSLSNASQRKFDEGIRKAMKRIAVACGKKFGVDVGYENLPGLVEELLTRPDTTQPQLPEERYVLHGDIKPCTVLYSDHTTTLLRLPEGDTMLETDTIEWSDSVTYRCQELLRSTGLNKINLTRVSGHLAQLVRDERILLNDDALEGGTVELETSSPVGVGTSVTHCPQCHTPTER